MRIIDKKLKELKPYDNNPRHNAKAVPAVKESILKFGFKVPIVVDKNNIIVCGHTRFYASKEIGLETVPCIVADDLTEEQINAFRLVDNRVSEFAEWNYDKLAEELSDLQEFDLEPFGFDDLMAGLEAQYDTKENDVIEDDYNAEPPAETNIKYGDIYQLGKHRLMCGDSTKEDDVEKLMSGEKADMVFTDPPYGVAYTGGMKIEKGKIKSNGKNQIKNDNLNYNELYRFLYQCFINLKNNSKQKSAIYIFYAASRSREFLNSFFDAGLKQRSIIAWRKIGGGFGDFMAHYMHEYEPCIYGSNGDVVNWYGASNEKTIWEIEKEKKCDLHPTMKPIKLVEKAVKNSSKKNDSILDLFGGSGSTLIACEQLNRICYMMELDPSYCDVIISRWEKFTGKKAEKING